MTQPSTRPKKRLLLVDDNPRNLTLLELRLQTLGHELLFAHGGAEAIALYDQRSPDMVLLDLMMPDIDGLEVLKHIRARDAHVPVILVTAHSERSYRLQGLQAGADEFLEKPIDAPILLARVTTLLKLKESRDELAASNEALAVRNRDLEHLQREQRELIQFVVHDLKNQLFVVLGNLDWARHNVRSAPAHEMVGVLEEGTSGAMRLRSMVEDLLVVSNLEDATFRVRSELVPVADIVRDVLSAYERKAEQKRVSLNAPASASHQLWGDPALLRRVIENILDNSLRHVPSAGHVSIQTRLGRLLEISISNDGPPVPPEDRERIFEKFARGSGEAPAVGNAGLGLYFCKRAVEAHGGQIKVLETTEWPTSFVIELPTGT
ncbi:MAG TPA: hybrid sensor histidine kinase/response regulator [Polyangiales bacterium]|nr:hybrid sensor histidine kinase/response regulator [Polyangiales bacterium]